MRLFRALGIAFAAILGGAALTGCAPQAPSHDSGRIAVVASTSVYGDIAGAIGGDAVKVTSLLSDPAQDPHSFEAGARAQLALSEADVVIENGGGYDGFVDTLLAGSHSAAATVVNAVDVSGMDHSGSSFNEHVWYDFPSMAHLAQRLTRVFSERDPSHQAAFSANGAAFLQALGDLKQEAAAVADAYAGTGVAITEPVPLYLLTACGLVNRTPVAFSRAIEDGTGVPPALMHSMLGLFSRGRVRLLVYNEQTSGPETASLRAAAKAAGIPAVPVTETLPADRSYLEWMADNISAVKEALAHG
jgi:zinc/manganese transport system substrate-binding protein